MLRVKFFVFLACIFMNNLTVFAAHPDGVEWFIEYKQYLSSLQEYKQKNLKKYESIESVLNDNAKDISMSNIDDIKSHLSFYTYFILVTNFNKAFIEPMEKLNSLSNYEKKIYFDNLEIAFEKFKIVRKSHNDMVENYFLNNKEKLEKNELKNLKYPESIKNQYMKSLTEYKVESKQNYDDIKNGKPPRFGKTAKLRELAKNDVVSQVLNYSSGEAEDGSGTSFFYPIDTDNGKCVYKIGIDKSNPLAASAAEMIEGFNQLNNIPGMQGMVPNIDLKGNIDLGKVDLNNITFYKINSQNKKTKEPILAYQTKIEGLPDYFNCDSNLCNIERLKRGWNLVKEKCKGTQKAF
jgi:hypothetical protein